MSKKHPLETDILQFLADHPTAHVIFTGVESETDHDINLQSFVNFDDPLQMLKIFHSLLNAAQKAAIRHRDFALANLADAALETIGGSGTIKETFRDPAEPPS